MFKVYQPKPDDKEKSATLTLLYLKDNGDGSVGLKAVHENGQHERFILAILADGTLFRNSGISGLGFAVDDNGCIKDVF